MASDIEIGRALERIKGTADEAKKEAKRASDGVTRLSGGLAQLAKDVRKLAGQEESDEPKRISWFLVDLEGTPDAAELMSDLTDWVDRVLMNYPRAATVLQAACWPYHPDVVEELLALAGAWREAVKGSGKPLAEWHDRFLPGVITRIAVTLGGCSLAEHTNHRGTPAAPAELASAAETVAEWWQATRGRARQPIPSPDFVREVSARMSGR